MKALLARRFPTMKPRRVLVLDPEAPASSLGWLEAHVKMPLVSWLARFLADARHPLHAAAVDRLDVYELAAMTSEPIELVEIVEAAVEHRLRYAFPAGIPLEEDVPGPVNVEALDWARSLRVAAAQRLARRVNRIALETRGDAARVLLGMEVSVEKHAGAVAALVRAGLVVAASPASEGRLALARAVLDDEDGRVVFEDALELTEEERRAIDRSGARGQMRMRGAAENARAATSTEASAAPVAPEEVPRRYATLRQATEGKRPSATALAAYAELLYQSKADPVQAAKFFERAVAADPTNAYVLQNYATFLRVEKRDLDRAQEVYERAIAADPMNAIALNNFATFLRVERRDLDRAQEMYERAIAADPMNAIALGNFALFLHDERRDLNRAQEMFEHAIAANPKYANALCNFANFLRDERRDLDRAQEMFERAIAADPNNAKALGDFAIFLIRDRRDIDRAQEMFERAIAADPNNANTLGNFANFLRLERRDIDGAQELYERAIAADPKSVRALDQFAIFLQDERHDLDRAQELYERALRAAPTDADTLGNLAHLLFLTGRRPAAIGRLREAIAHADAAPEALKSSLASELAFYRAVHLPDERAAALRDLRALIAHGARSPGWNFRAHAALAEKAGDADAPLFAALADVLSGKADAATLATFPRWTDASPLPTNP